MEGWGYFEPSQEVLGKHTNSFPPGHPWPPLASWSCSPTQPTSVLLKSEVCALFYKMWKPISLIRPTLTSLLCLVPGAVQGYGNEGFYFLRHGFHLKKLTG